MGGLRDGLLLVNKPQGPTSHDVVAAVRRAIGQRRVGHAGTLDPMATGLLPLVLGRATRLVRFLPGSPKTYVGSLRLGCTSDTDDVTGRVVERSPGWVPPRDQVIRQAGELEGHGEQVPPAYSARKVRGRKLYDLARRGIETPRPAAPVEVHRFELSATDQPDRFEFIAEVSAGTYIRALARDLGELLGCGAVLASLTRTAIGPMRLEDALDDPLDAAAAGRLVEALIPLEQMPLEPPVLRLSDPDQARQFELGAAVPAPEGAPAGAMLRVHDPSGRLLGVAERRDVLLHPRVVLPHDRG